MGELTLRPGPMPTGRAAGPTPLNALGDNVLTTTLDKVINWGRSSAIWPALFGLACCSIKMAPVLRQIYDQMPEPKWVIAMGACASSAGMFNNYAIVQSVDKIVPVDIYLPGCPPRPEALIDAVIKLQRKIRGEPLVKRPA